MRLTIGSVDHLRPLRGDCNARDVQFGETKSVVHPGVRRILLARVRLWVSAGRLALRSGRSGLGGGSSAALVASLATLEFTNAPLPRPRMPPGARTRAAASGVPIR